jgi:hypothetical protein
MNMAVDSLVANGPQLVAIWLVLLVLAAGCLTALADRGGLLGPVRIAARLAALAQQRRHDRTGRTTRAVEATRYTEEIVVAARRATTTVQRHREQWHDAQQVLDTASDAYQEAGERVLDACRAAAHGVPAIGPTPAHYAERERYLHTTAVETHRRGHLSTAQLRDALAHRNGWDPRLHPSEQDVALARAGRTHLHELYQLAVAAERDAWHEAGMAVSAARILRSEAQAAVSTGRPTPERMTESAARQYEYAIAAPSYD